MKTSTSPEIATPEQTLDTLRLKLREFASERDWEQFHTPKNLAMALSVEASEIVEHFQWLTAEKSQELDKETREKVSEEIGDVINYVVRLADILGIDPLDAAIQKIESNARKYPVDRSKGNARKYTEIHG